MFLLISPEIQAIQGSQVCDTCREVPDTNLRTLCQLCAWGLDTLCVCVCVCVCVHACMHVWEVEMGELSCST